MSRGEPRERVSLLAFLCCPTPYKISCPPLALVRPKEGQLILCRVDSIQVSLNPLLL